MKRTQVPWKRFSPTTHQRSQKVFASTKTFVSMAAPEVAMASDTLKDGGTGRYPVLLFDPMNSEVMENAYAAMNFSHHLTNFS